MNRVRLLMLAGVALAVLACESRSTKDEDSPFFSIPPGSMFTLVRELTVLPDQTSVYLQDGKTRAVSDVDFYRPHCMFELFTISAESRLVQPDTFIVTRIVDRSEDVSASWPTYAGLGLAVGDGPIHLTFSTTIYLESKMQPDVFRMECKRWDHPSMGAFLSINEMRQALGDYFTITLAD